MHVNLSKTPQQNIQVKQQILNNTIQTKRLSSNLNKSQNKKSQNTQTNNKIINPKLIAKSKIQVIRIHLLLTQSQRSKVQINKPPQSLTSNKTTKKT